MNEITNIKFENTSDIISEIENAFFDIPFDNSNFQTEAFVIGGQITPERAYRAIGLRMYSKLRALNEAKYSKMNTDIDLDEIEYKLANENLSTFDRRRQELKKEQILSELSWHNKLINDAITELNILYGHFKRLPKYTREQFESAERLHFEQRLHRQVLGFEGAKESLVNMNEDLSALKMYEEKVGLLQNISNVDLLQLTKMLPNMIKEKS